MFESFYGLSAKPFSLLPDSDFLYRSRKHNRAINLLDYGILNQAGFIVITGDVGAGKTTVIRRYIKNAGSDVTIGIITNPSATLGKLLGWVTAAFDIKSADQSDSVLYSSFVEFLVTQYASGKRTILIIDEAQNLKADLLEELRMLSNVNNEKDQLLQIILVGQPELLETLNQPNLRQFAQRISVHCHLGPLTPIETASYIRHRLRVVNGSPEIFSDTACAVIHHFTGGVPRLINLLCDQAMVYGFSEDQTTIDFKTVVDVVADRNGGGLNAFRALPPGWTIAGVLNEVQPVLTEIVGDGKVKRLV